MHVIPPSGINLGACCQGNQAAVTAYNVQSQLTVNIFFLRQMPALQPLLKFNAQNSFMFASLYYVQMKTNCDLPFFDSVPYYHLSM